MSDKQSVTSGPARGPTRRRAIRIVAAAAGLPLMIAAVRATAPRGRLFDWQGEVLGALAELSLWHTDEAAARRTIRKVETEIARYERIFSLARADSEISRLNAAGILAKPSPELRGRPCGTRGRTEAPAACCLAHFRCSSNSCSRVTTAE